MDVREAQGKRRDQPLRFTAEAAGSSAGRAVDQFGLQTRHTFDEYEAKVCTIFSWRFMRARRSLALSSTGASACGMREGR